MSDRYIPNDPINVPLRPLNKGMIRNVSPTQMPNGSGWTVRDYIVNENGLRRRPGWQQFANSATIVSLHQPVRDLATVWSSTGAQTAILIGEKFIYQIGLITGYTGKYWTYSTGHARVSGTFVIGSNTVWASTASELQAGDTIIMSTGASAEEQEIQTVSSNTQLVLRAALVGTYGTMHDYHIRRAFDVPEGHLIDWTVVDYKLVLADGSRFLYAYDTSAGTFGDFASGETYIPRCVLFYADRLWIANVEEGGEFKRQRIRWSSATTRTSFDDADYLDLPYSAGEIMRLLPLGNMMICYLEDTLYYGRPSNMTDLPYTFNRIESGKRGLIGTRAVISWLGSNYFVSQDGIYEITSDLSIKPIGNPVINETIRSCGKPENIYVEVDQNNDRIVFGFPESGENIAKLWSYNYKSQAWSYEEKESTMLASAFYDFPYSWDDLTGLATDDWDTGMATFASWSAISTEKGKRRLYRGLPNGSVEQCSESASADVGEIAPVAMFETGDMDFGEPDLDKCVLRLSVRIAREVGTAGALSFLIYGSRNSGGDWTSLGTINISATKSEGFVNFRMTGSIFRFRLISSSNISPYSITEVVLRVRGRGLETQNV
jgi:hypothetical protein